MNDLPIEFMAPKPTKVEHHLGKLWTLSRRFFSEGDYGLAVAFGTTLIEEVGKVIRIRLSGESSYDHTEKYAHAVGFTLPVNSRVSRIYGDAEHRFAALYRDGKEGLFRLRNAGMYFEFKDGDYIIPEQAISREDAFLVVCFAGEIYGDAQGAVFGTGPDQWQRIISEVDTFREANA